jgi:cellulose synthase operon protein C
MRRHTFPAAWALAVALLGIPAASCAQPAPQPDRFHADISAAEAAAERGERADAAARARRIASVYEQEGARSSSEHTSAGRAYVLLGNGDANAIRSALAAFDRAVAADSGNIDALRRIGQLFLDKYNAP